MAFVQSYGKGPDPAIKGIRPAQYDEWVGGSGLPGLRTMLHRAHLYGVHSGHALIRGIKGHLVHLAKAGR